MGCDHLDDASLIERFEALQIAGTDFRHVEHVRLAFALLQREGDLAEAAIRFRRGLRRFADSLGASTKYHETLTWAYLALIHETMHRDPARDAEGSRAWIARHPDLLDHRGGAMSRHYDVDELTASPTARAVFVLPTR